MPNPQVSLLIPAKDSAHSLESTVQEAHRFLSRHYGSDFEIILIPTLSSRDETASLAKDLATRTSGLIVAPHSLPIGKGAALKTGMKIARGNFIFFTDADLPYDLEFFVRADRELRSGFDLVTGNRRLPSSQFDIPVELLPIAYQRHRMGLAFNWVVKRFFPIQTGDTQAGIKAMSRTLADEAFKRVECPGFFFDLEIFLTAKGMGLKSKELPITLYLNTEKSTVRIVRDFIAAAYWLTRIVWKNLRGDYGKIKKPHLFSRYGNISLKTRTFLWLRNLMTPYSKMSAELPVKGRLLDWGCGHGLFTLALALDSPHREIIGIDHDSERVKLASQSLKDLKAVQIETGSLLDPTPPSELNRYDGIALIDVMHYFKLGEQKQILEDGYSRLVNGGILIFREVNPEGGIVSSWNRLYERIATRSGFTQSKEESLTFRSVVEWRSLSESLGFQVHSFPCSSPIFSDILYVCQKRK